jgi:hypothetical protein
MFSDGYTIPMSDEDYKIRYIAQLEFINAQVAKTIDSILANSTTPPIIIVQADHGPRMYTDFDSEKDTCLKEAFSVFAAYYLPGIDPEAIPQDISSVNLFRIIFNNYFGADMDLLNRKHYFDTSRLYMPEDVTSRVDTCARP